MRFIGKQRDFYRALRIGFRYKDGAAGNTRTEIFAERRDFIVNNNKQNQQNQNQRQQQNQQNQRQQQNQQNQNQQ